MRKRPEMKILIRLLQSPEAKHPSEKRKRKVSVRLTKKYDDLLETLSKITGKSKSELIREAVDILLKKNYLKISKEYRKHVKNALKMYLETQKRYGRN